MRRRYVWDPELKELVEVGATPNAAEHHHFVRGDIQEFKSPINGQVIGSRSKLRAHMKTHRVIPTAELCPKELQQKAQDRQARQEGRTPAQRRDRIEALKHAITVAKRGYV